MCLEKQRFKECRVKKTPEGWSVQGVLFKIRKVPLSLEILPLGIAAHFGMGRGTRIMVANIFRPLS